MHGLTALSTPCLIPLPTTENEEREMARWRDGSCCSRSPASTVPYFWLQRAVFRLDFFFCCRLQLHDRFRPTPSDKKIALLLDVFFSWAHRPEPPPTQRRFACVVYHSAGENCVGALPYDRHTGLFCYFEGLRILTAFSLENIESKSNSRSTMIAS